MERKLITKKQILAGFNSQIKVAISLGIFSISSISFAQFKVTNNGRVAVGQNTVSSDFKMEVNSGEICALNLITNSRTNYSWSSVASVGHSTIKNWIVRNGKAHNYFVYGDGVAVGKSFNRFSDSTLKFQITPINNYYTIVNAINGRYYKYKEFDHLTDDSIGTDSVYRKRHVGFIAQELNTVLPEAVLYNPADSLYSVDYSAITPLLVEYVKHLNRRLDSVSALLNACCSNNQMAAPIDEEHSIYNENNSDLMYKIFPNPVENGIVNISVSQLNMYDKVLVTDLSGKILHSQVMDLPSMNKKIVLPQNISNQMVLVSIMHKGRVVSSESIVVSNN